MVSMTYWSGGTTFSFSLLHHLLEYGWLIQVIQVDTAFFQGEEKLLESSARVNKSSFFSIAIASRLWPLVRHWEIISIRPWSYSLIGHWVVELESFILAVIVASIAQWSLTAWSSHFPIIHWTKSCDGCHLFRARSNGTCTCCHCSCCSIKTLWESAVSSCNLSCGL